MIEIKINVSLIDKARLYTGKQGKYLTAVLIPTPDGKYGDWMVIEGISKEEREAGKKGTILGNGKNLAKKPAEPPQSDFQKIPPKIEDQESADEMDGSLPF